MTTAYHFIGDFLFGQQTVAALRILDQECPESDLHRILDEDDITILLPADDGILLTAHGLGYGGENAEVALRYIIEVISQQFHQTLITALLQFVSSHILTGQHLAFEADRERSLETLAGGQLFMSPKGVSHSATGGTVKYVLSDLSCENGVVQVLARPLLPPGLHGFEANAARSSLIRDEGDLATGRRMARPVRAARQSRPEPLPSVAPPVPRPPATDPETEAMLRRFLSESDNLHLFSGRD